MGKTAIEQQAGEIRLAMRPDGSIWSPPVQDVGLGDILLAADCIAWVSSWWELDGGVELGTADETTMNEWRLAGAVLAARIKGAEHDGD